MEYYDRMTGDQFSNAMALLFGFLLAVWLPRAARSDWAFGYYGSCMFGVSLASLTCFAFLPLNMVLDIFVWPASFVIAYVIWNFWVFEPECDISFAKFRGFCIVKDLAYFSGLAFTFLVCDLKRFFTFVLVFLQLFWVMQAPVAVFRFWKKAFGKVWAQAVREGLVLHVTWQRTSSETELLCGQRLIEIERITTELSSADLEMSALKKKNEEFQEKAYQEHKQLRGKIMELETQVEKQGKDLEIGRGRTKYLERQENGIPEKVDTAFANGKKIADKQLADLRARMEEEIREKEDLQAELASHKEKNEKAVEALEARLKLASRHNSRADKNNKDLQQVRINLRDTQDELARKNLEYDRDFKTSQELHTKLKNALAKKTKELKTLQEAHSLCSSNVPAKDLQRALGDLHNAKDEAARQRQDRKHETKIFSDLYVKAQNDLAEKTQAYNDLQAAHGKCNQNAQVELTAKIQEFDQLKAQHAQCNQNVSLEHERKARELGQLKSEHALCNPNAQTELAAKSQELDNLKAQHAQCSQSQKDLAGKMQELENLKAEHALCSRNSQSVQHDLAAKSQELENIKTEYARCNQNAQFELESKAQELDQLKAEHALCSHNSQDLAVKTQEFENLKAEHALCSQTAHKDIAVKMQELENLKTEHARCGQNTAALRSECMQEIKKTRRDAEQAVAAARSQEDTLRQETSQFKLSADQAVNAARSNAQALQQQLAHAAQEKSSMESLLLGARSETDSLRLEAWATRTQAASGPSEQQQKTIDEQRNELTRLCNALSGNISFDDDMTDQDACDKIIDTVIEKPEDKAAPFSFGCATPQPFAFQPPAAPSTSKPDSKFTINMNQIVNRVSPIRSRNPSAATPKVSASQDKLFGTPPSYLPGLGGLASGTQNAPPPSKVSSYKSRLDAPPPFESVITSAAGAKKPFAGFSTPEAPKCSPPYSPLSGKPGIPVWGAPSAPPMPQPQPQAASKAKSPAQANSFSFGSFMQGFESKAAPGQSPGHSSPFTVDAPSVKASQEKLRRLQEQEKQAKAQQMVQPKSSRDQEMANLQTEIARLNKEIAERNNTISALRANASMSKEQNTRLREANKTLDKNLGIAYSQIDLLEEQRKKLVEAVESLGGKVDLDISREEDAEEEPDDEVMD